MRSLVSDDSKARCRVIVRAIFIFDSPSKRDSRVAGYSTTRPPRRLHSMRFPRRPGSRRSIARYRQTCFCDRPGNNWCRCRRGRSGRRCTSVTRSWERNSRQGGTCQHAALRVIGRGGHQISVLDERQHSGDVLGVVRTIAVDGAHDLGRRSPQGRSRGPPPPRGCARGE